MYYDVEYSHLLYSCSLVMNSRLRRWKAT